MIRKNSKTFGQYVTAVLNDQNKRMLFIPRGFAHGFLVLSDQAEFLYKVDQFYSPEHERGILWNDPELNIPWPYMKEYFLSERDQKHPIFKNAL